MRKADRHRIFTMGLFGAAWLMSAAAAHAEQIRVFLKDMPYEASIDLAEFESSISFSYETILFGGYQDGIISIMVEQESHFSSLEAIRVKYQKNVEGAKILDAKTTSGENMCIVIAPNKGPGESVKINAYVFKNSFSFDIHLSVQSAKFKEEAVVQMLLTFRLDPSPESDDMKKLLTDLDSDKAPKEKDLLIKAFATKYPANTWGSIMLAEHYSEQDQHVEAKAAYEQALKNNKTQPIANPLMLWKCHDGLGICLGMEEKYPEAKKHFELACVIAEDIDNERLLAASIYNLACCCAEANDPEQSAEFLKKTIELNPENKTKAMKDSSFDKIRDNAAIKEALQ